jgi:hypothetical protein
MAHQRSASPIFGRKIVSRSSALWNFCLCASFAIRAPSRNELFSCVFPFLCARASSPAFQVLRPSFFAALNEFGHKEKSEVTRLIRERDETRAGWLYTVHYMHENREFQNENAKCLLLRLLLPSVDTAKCTRAPWLTPNAENRSTRQNQVCVN